ncbi:MAG: Trehalose/maltose import ATP-binding protein MalK [Methanocella sp. PtaU1.Bin125]|nr:MAG: Trehalose/maltose import ATP-binding protein MalK [Methanocella sp. PtaU1.Bin125]
MLRIRAKKQLRDFVLEVDISAGERETLVLMGSNGSGKTTLLDLIAGTATPDDGLIQVDGRTLYDSDEGVNLPPEQRDIGYVYQHYALFPHLTVYDNVAFGLRTRRMPGEDIDRRVMDELEFVGLRELRNARASKLSGGQKQKVALARALAIKPSLLLLDEPLSALDIQTSARVRDCLRERIKKDGIPCIVVLHNPLDAVTLGDRACVLDLGQVVLTGKPGDLIMDWPAGCLTQPREIQG